MKRYLVILLILAFQACIDLFPKNEKLLKEYVLRNGEKIQLYYINLGATSSNIIQIRKKNRGQNSLISIIKGFNDTYPIEVNQINDTLLKITFIDTTSIWKGPNRDFEISLNDSATIKQ